MVKENQDQVHLNNLVFSHNWEDPLIDSMVLKIQKNNAVLAITSGGCNVLGFLLFNPKVVYSIDINRTQSFLLELKIAAIKILDFDDFINFSGLNYCENRLELFDRIKPQLSENTRLFWEENQQILSNGFIMNGKYERFINYAGKLLKLIQGKKRIERLFHEKTKEEQEFYFDTVWNTRRFKYIFKILFNKYMLAKKGLVADYFHFDDGSTSFAESFYKRSKKAFRNLPIKGNYFLSLYLLGKYRSPEEVPDYLKRENFEIIKSRVDRIQIFTTDAQSWFDSMSNETIDCFALSNICELMSEEETNRLFLGVHRTGRAEARIIFRNLMIPRDVPANLTTKIVKDKALSEFCYKNDRSFVYGKVAAYTIKK